MVRHVLAHEPAAEREWEGRGEGEKADNSETPGQWKIGRR